MPERLPPVLTVADVPVDALRSLVGRYGLALVSQADGEAIKGSYWGDSEAGIIGSRVYVRADTPVHSLLHEMAHIVCMSGERRRRLDRDAGGDDLEEAAVCYLQVVLAAEIEGVGSERLMRDMDVWGYSFRLGTTCDWFTRDADDAFAWLLRYGLLGSDGTPTFELRA